jgi:hypothetical protein
MVVIIDQSVLNCKWQLWVILAREFTGSVGELGHGRAPVPP